MLPPSPQPSLAPRPNASTSSRGLDPYLKPDTHKNRRSCVYTLFKNTSKAMSGPPSSLLASDRPPKYRPPFFVLQVGNTNYLVELISAYLLVGRSNTIYSPHYFLPFPYKHFGPSHHYGITFCMVDGTYRPQDILGFKRMA